MTGTEPFLLYAMLRPVRTALASNDTLTTHQWQHLLMAAPPR